MPDALDKSAADEAIRRLGKLPVVTMTELHAKVRSRLPHDLCRYSAYDTHKYPDGKAVGTASRDDDWLVYDNTDVVPVPGRAIFRCDGWGDVDVYLSGVETDAPWWRITVIADEAIKATGDHHHVYLEGVAQSSDVGTDGTRIYDLVMGSLRVLRRRGPVPRR